MPWKEEYISWWPYTKSTSSAQSISFNNSSAQALVHEEINCNYHVYEEGETQVSSSNEDDLEEDNESSVEVIISGIEISEGDDSDHNDNDHNDNTNVHGMTYDSSRNAESVQQIKSK